jgi:hypothetical protein
MATAALMVGAVIVAVGASEAALRLFYPVALGVWHQDRDGLALHWPRLHTHLQEFGVSVSFNSLGMRGPEPGVAKSARALRVLVLGDSFMEALQVPYEASFPSLLERELERRTARPIEIVNASVSGWGTDDELKYLTAYGMKCAPDLVLVAMTLHNDINDNLRERFHAMRDGVLVEQSRTTASAMRYKLIELRDFLATRSQAYTLLLRARRAREMKAEAGQLSDHVFALFSEPPDERIRRGVELTALLLERMQQVASADGSRVALILLPLEVQLSEQRFAALTAAAPAHARHLHLARPQRLMTDVGDRLGLEVIDLLPSFRAWTAEGRQRLYLERDGHWNVSGHHLAADIVAGELIRRGLVSSGLERPLRVAHGIAGFPR